MKRKNLWFVLLTAILTSFTLVSCDEESEEQITLLSGQQLQQTVNANDMVGTSSISFETKAAWSSRIVDASTSQPVNWLSIDPVNGDKPGEYTINISLEENTSDVARSARILITCEGKTVTIVITQKGSVEGGITPEKPRLITKITPSYKKYNEELHGDSNIYEFKYDIQDRLKEYHINGSYNSYKYIYSYDIQGEIRLTEGEYDSYVAKLNNNGYISSIDIEDEYSDGFSFTYNSLGQIQKVTRSNDYDLPIDFSWTNDNLTSRTTYDNNSFEYPNTYPQYYSTHPNNKTNIDLNAFFFGIVASSGVDNSQNRDGSYDSYVNLFSMIDATGIRSKNLMTGRDWDESHWSAGGVEYHNESTVPEIGSTKKSYNSNLVGEATYTFDGEGYPILLSQSVKVSKKVATYNGERREIPEWEKNERHQFGIVYDYSFEEDNDVYTFTIEYNK